MSAVPVSEVNRASRSMTLEPYGQLIRMLMPRAQSIAIYDRMGMPLWMSDGRDVPELRRLLQEALSDELHPDQRSTGRMQPMDAEHAAYVFLLRGAYGPGGAQVEGELAFQIEVEDAGASGTPATTPGATATP